jgi:hypothetical protein
VHLAKLIESPDAKLKRQVFSALSQISKHSVELAEMVNEAEIFPAILKSLKGAHYITLWYIPEGVIVCIDCDEYVQKNVATLIREISKHSPEVGIDQ